MEKKVFFGFIIFFLCAFVYRIYGIFHVTPFWVDEFSTANQARLAIQYGLGAFRNSAINFEPHNSLYHFIVGSFFKILGESEFAARLPSVIAGAAVPSMVFLLGYLIFNFNTAIIAGLLTTFSYFEITWSRQARGYVFLQFFLLLTLFLYIQITQNNKKTWPYIISFLISTFLCLLMHSLFYLFILALVLHFIFTNIKFFAEWIRHPLPYVILLMIGIVAYFSNFLPSLFTTFGGGRIVQANNLWYYHSFLWREYGLVTFLALIGFLFALLSYKRFSLFIFLYAVIHLFFTLFVFQAYVSRYLLPLWPFILILMAYALDAVAQLLSKKTTIPATTIGLLLVLSIIVNGHKFVLKPKSFYSVNHDFREIALVDYNKVYNYIRQKGDLENGKTVVIDTWDDRTRWYLGMDFTDLYIFRWLNEEGRINGLAKKTYYTFNNQGEKILKDRPNVRLMGELSDLKQALAKYPKGFIFIDDSSLPKDVRQYAEKNFHKELYLDHYPLDDNPYSIWPATLYSWGIAN